MYTILCNQKGSRQLSISEEHLSTIDRYSLFTDLLDSNGIVEESVLEKLRLNVRSLLSSMETDTCLINLCEQVLFHNDMKALGLYHLILLFIDWKKKQLDELKATVAIG